MEKCSKHLIKQLEECLPEKVRYLPSFIFHLFESLIRLLYHDTIIIENYYISRNPALTYLRLKDKLSRYLYFFSNFLDLNKCFIQQLHDECKQDGEIKTFEKDLEEAVRKPCEMK
nr:unnamed protein product [Callosobruchus chinensis]